MLYTFCDTQWGMIVIQFTQWNPCGGKKTSIRWDVSKNISLIKKREKCKQFPEGCKRERYFVPYLSKMMDSAANPRKSLRDAIKQGGKKEVGERGE